MTSTVGILIPTCGRPALLRLALDSARRQEGAEVRVIVIDNAPTGEAGGLVESLRDPRISYVANPENIGLSGSVNKGVSLFPPEVEWITVLADDDVLDSGFVRSAIGCAERTGARSVVDGHRMFIDKDGAKIRDAHRPAASASAFEYIKSRARFWRESYLTGVFFRREAFEKSGGYPVFSTGAGTDDAFLFSLALQDRLCHAQEAVARIRVHPEAESRNAARALDHLKSTSELEAYVLARAEASGLFDRRQIASLRKWLRSYIAMSNDLLWNARAGSAIVEEGPAKTEGIGHLCGVAKEGAFPFTARTRANAFLLARTGLFLESHPAYRTAWRIVKLLNILRMELG
jgi:hypothetical protein